jgi:hypothetical protein
MPVNIAVTIGVGYVLIIGGMIAKITRAKIGIGAKDLCPVT